MSLTPASRDQKTGDWSLLGNGTINDSSVDDLDSSGQPCCWELLCVFGPAIVVGDRFR